MDTPPSSIHSSRASRHRTHRPIFVDATGRKLRLMRATGAVALILVAGYLGVVGLALLGNSPNAAAPFLPPAAAPAAPAPTPHPTREPADAGTWNGEVPSPAQAGADEPAQAVRGPAPTSPAGGAPVPADLAAQPTPVPAAAAAPAPTAPAAAPTAAQPTSQGNPAAPGQTRRATPPAHP